MQYFVNQLRRLMLANGAVKRTTLALLDILVAAGSAVLSFWLRLGTWEIALAPVAIFFAMAIVAWFVAAKIFGIYSQIIRYAGIRTVADIVAASFIHGVVLVVAVVALAIPGIPRTVSIIHVVLFTAAVISSRAIMRVIISDLLPTRSRRRAQRTIFIYGAGKAGQELAISMRSHPEMRLAGFFDDNLHMQGRRVDGVAVWGAQNLGHVLRSNAVDEVILALPRVNRARRAEIVSMLERQSVHVRTVPDMSSLLKGQITVKDVHEVKVEDLLGREPVAPDMHLLSSSITGKVVMITGAGGSIGSELARQARQLNPRKLILLDVSEAALFAIEQQILAAGVETANGSRQLDMHVELCNCADEESIGRVVALYRPDTLFHAAAYKHVPMLEANPLSAARNNILGTLATAQAARACGVERFVLVSTDKAVRPTNIMGATKRICELILQAMAAESRDTIFAMVRFGNVLGSSGSVVPHFRRQIEKGGPVTVTHRSITRYFMTIPEAAQLVIQAGAMARSGEVFLLEMGEAVRIIALAETMIRLSGLTVRNEGNPDGDIEIVETGLRPGEKLFEELLIDSSAQPTAHARIYSAEEAMLPWAELETNLRLLKDALARGDVATVVAVVGAIVPAYQPSDAFRQLRQTGEAGLRAAN